mmetsp:Transcript_67089/g.132959  ORF Transcript_67089/g.132959 Transcript_67089/m.132959 type:complete len:324 (-) Transcript_67089:299-1270(-)
MATFGSDGTGGRIHLEPGHRVIAETVRARVNAEPSMREACDVKADDFDGVSIYVNVKPEQKDMMYVSIFAPCFAEIKDAVGDQYFADLYAPHGTVDSAPQPGYNQTFVFDLNQLPPTDEGKDQLVNKVSTIKRDVVGAALWVCFKALLTGSKTPRSYYVIPFRPKECMYIVPQDDLVVVVFAISFENHVEQAIAKVFLQEICISRRQSRDLMTAPSVTYTPEPPHELKTINPPIKPNVDPKFCGYVSLAISKRIVESGRLEKVVTLTEGYRSFLMYHVQATKSQLHTRIRRRANSWLQVVHRAMPEKLNVEKKTIKGRTFNRT